MSKKKKKSFTDGLDTMFSAGLEEQSGQEGPALLKSNASRESRRRRNLRSKSFSNTLESIFSESTESELDNIVAETLVETKRQLELAPKDEAPKATGLDLLLTQTAAEEEEPSTKRLTLTLEREKVERLKHIAKEEKRRLRNIIDELVSEYIQKKTRTGTL